jgi:chemotaxis signal transduction protein
MDERSNLSIDAAGTATHGVKRSVASEYVALFGIRIGSINLLLDAHDVLAVTAMEPPTRVPGTPGHILGLVPHGDGALSIVDLAAFLGIADAGAVDYGDVSSLRVVCVRVGELEAGLLCQQAIGVAQIRSDSLQPASVLRGGRLGEFVAQEVEFRGARFGIMKLKPLLEAARSMSRRGG